MKNGLLISFAMLSFGALAAEHSLSAHEHGSIKLSVAVEKNTMDIDLDGPSESFTGFEHAPKSARETKIFNETKDLFEKKLLTLITPPAALDCKISESVFKQEVEGTHAGIEVKAKITCAKDLAGSEAQISMLKAFKKIKKLKMEILSTSTASVDITKPVQTIKL